MWYAIIFISYLELAHLQIDTTTEYAGARQCVEATKKNIQDLNDALLEHSTPAQKTLGGKPYVAFKCVKLPIRKT